MQPIPYLFFKDQARQAFTLYAEIFGNEPEIMSFADMPAEDQAQMPGVPADAVMHAAIRAGDGWLYGSDDPTGAPPEMSGCNVHVEFPDEAATRRAFDLLSQGGEVRMPLAPMFWAPLFGTCTDRFGIRWMVAQQTPQT